MATTGLYFFSSIKIFNEYYDNLNMKSQKQSKVRNFEKESKGIDFTLIEQNMSLSSLSFAPFEDHI